MASHNVLPNRLVSFPTFEEYYAQRLFQLLYFFAIFGMVLVTIYLGFDYIQYGDTPLWGVALSTRLIALFFALLVVLSVKLPSNPIHTVWGITLFGTLGYSTITIGYMALGSPYYYLALNWMFYLAATVMLSPLLSKRLYITMESYQIALALGVMYVYGLSESEIFTYTFFAIPLALYIFAVIAIGRKMGIEAYNNAYKTHLLSSLDGLTHLLNRRSWYDRANDIYADDKGVSFIMLDIDHFKRVNDTYGHDAGDIVISTVASILLEHTREKDIIGRLGGEEFAILLPQTTLNEAIEIAERIRNVVEEREMKHNENSLHITISLGVAINSFKNDNLSALVTQGDKCLYDAKESGRNRVVANFIEENQC